MVLFYGRPDYCPKSTLMIMILSCDRRRLCDCGGLTANFSIQKFPVHITIVVILHSNYVIIQIYIFKIRVLWENPLVTCWPLSDSAPPVWGARRSELGTFPISEPWVFMTRLFISPSAMPWVCWHLWNSLYSIKVSPTYIADFIQFDLYFSKRAAI